MLQITSAFALIMFYGLQPCLGISLFERKASPQKSNNASVFPNFPSDTVQMSQCLTLSFGTFSAFTRGEEGDDSPSVIYLS